MALKWGTCTAHLGSWPEAETLLLVIRILRLLLVFAAASGARKELLAMETAFSNFSFLRRELAFETIAAGARTRQGLRTLEISASPVRPKEGETKLRRD